MILGLEQEITQDEPAMLVLLEGKRVLIKQTNQKSHSVMGYIKGTLEPVARAPSGQIWNSLSHKIKCD